MSVHDCVEPHEHSSMICSCDVERLYEQMQRIEGDLAEIQESL